MTPLEILVLLVVAAVCGAIGQAITGYSGGGLIVSIALGFIGALIGLWIARALALPEILMVKVGDVNFPVVWSIIGAALFVAAVGLLTYRRGEV
jgi:uncharacterized membrane protein YeaQ/YmgE (transglycosylase-associated protein family)